MADIPMMKLRTGILVAAALLTSCQDRGTPAEGYRNWGDRLAVATGLRATGLVWPCTVKEQTKFGPVYASTPVDQCYKMDPPQRWRGVWRNDFEGSRFCPEPAKNCSFDSVGERIWLGASIPFPDAIKNRRLGGLYSIDFVGRKTRYKGAYGHLGGSNEEIIVDRLISIREIEVPPKPTKADLEIMKQNCRAIPSCSVEKLEKEETE